MAVTESLSRATVPGATHTICTWAYWAATGGNYRHIISMDDGGGEWYQLGTDIGGAGTSLRVYKRSVEATLLTIALNTWYFLALTRAASGLITWYYRTLAQTSLTSGTLAGGTEWTPTSLYLMTSGFGETMDGAARGARVWNAVQLTGAELYEESKQARAYRRSDLWMETPLRFHTDLTDKSGNGRNWTGSGVTTDTNLHDPVPDSLSDVLGAATTAHCGVIQLPTRREVVAYGSMAAAA